MTGPLPRHPGLPQSHGPAMSSEAKARRRSADPRAPAAFVLVRRAVIAENVFTDLVHVTNEFEGNVQVGLSAGD